MNEWNCSLSRDCDFEWHVTLVATVSLLAGWGAEWPGSQAPVTYIHCDRSPLKQDPS
jgi:hypothetical protein